MTFHCYTTKLFFGLVWFFFFGTEAEKDPVKADFINRVILISHTTVYLTVIFHVPRSSGFTLISLLVDA